MRELTEKSQDTENNTHGLMDKTFSGNWKKPLMSARLTDGMATERRRSQKRYCKAP